MASYKVVVSSLMHNGKKCVRGDIIDASYGTRTELHIEPEAPAVEEKPKRKRRVKSKSEGSDNED